MKIKLKPLNRGDRKGHHSDDLTDAVAPEADVPEGGYIQRDAEDTSSSGTRIAK